MQIHFKNNLTSNCTILYFQPQAIQFYIFRPNLKPKRWIKQTIKPLRAKVVAIV